MKSPSIFFCSVATLFFSDFHPAYLLAQSNPFTAHVRSTDPRTPEEERLGFKLPPGFEIQLYASEPEISKPMNMAFDERGRLWVTETVEYPFPAAEGVPTGDSLKILEDTDGDGTVDKITTYADNLNIPMGVYPFDGNAIVYSIPNIYLLKDENGDGKADSRKVLFGPLGHRDTHGMNNAFRRAFDSWLYINHGFSNDSVVTATDGSSIKINSGNTYRVRLDGSRVEQYTWGQVNPFGSAFDSLGNYYTSDCHSSPIYQLVRGAYYPSFGKPHDGLGFAPAIMRHSHDSTAISGICIYEDDQFPEEFHHNAFIGNVMTSRINRDSFQQFGSTLKAIEQPDFLVSEDPWFRPVDIQLGPDGALYIADFYNRIIGHYEVPLEHPGRDRSRGRIWRIVYTGKDYEAPERITMGNLARAGVPKLLFCLGYPNLTVRLLALNFLADHADRSIAGEILKEWGQTSNPYWKIHAAWLLHRLKAIDLTTLMMIAKDSKPEVRIHAVRILAETARWGPQHRTLALAGLKDPDPRIRRGAADALGMHPGWRNILPLLKAYEKTPEQDVQLSYVLRGALRDQLKSSDVFENLDRIDLSDANLKTISEISLAVKTELAGAFLASRIRQLNVSPEALPNYLRFSIRYAPEKEISPLVQFIRSRLFGQLELQLDLLQSLIQGLRQRGVELPQSVAQWGEDLAQRLFDRVDPHSIQWTNTVLPTRLNSGNPWGIRSRKSSDGDERSLFFDSLLHGEKLTGILRSKVFGLPAEFSFYLAGHIGYPDRSDPPRNFVRIRDAETGEILQEVYPPRNDIAQKFTMDLSGFKGRSGYLEVEDGDSQGAFAWMAIGRFDPPLIIVAEPSPRKSEKRNLEACRLTADLGLSEYFPQTTAVLVDSRQPLANRIAAADACIKLNRDQSFIHLEEILKDSRESIRLRARIATVLGGMNHETAIRIMMETLSILPERMQVPLASAASSSTGGAHALLKEVEAGRVSARLLQRAGMRRRIEAAAPPDWENRLNLLTENLFPADEALKMTIASRLNYISSHQGNSSSGRQVYEKNCAACHQFKNEGNLVGPQLDGIGNRGNERLLEDIIDPNSNVDVTFRYSLYTLKDDQLISGLFRRQEGDLLILADSTGKELEIPSDEVVSMEVSEYSLMPENFGEILTAENLSDLLAFLTGE